MKLKELCEKISTYHFMVTVLKENDVKKYMYDTPAVNGTGVDNMEVVSVDVTTEIDKETPVSHIVMVRPILNIRVREVPIK